MFYDARGDEGVSDEWVRQRMSLVRSSIDNHTRDQREHPAKPS